MTDAEAGTCPPAIGGPVTKDVAHRSGWYRALTGDERAELTHSSPHFRLDMDLARRRLATLSAREPLKVVEDPLHAIRGCSESDLVAALGSSLSDLRHLGGEPSWLEELFGAFALEAAPIFRDYMDQLQPGDSRRLLSGIGRLADNAISDIAGLVERVDPASQLGLSVELLLPSLAESLLELTLQVLVLELNIARLNGQLSGSTPLERFGSFERLASTPEQTVEWLARYPVLARQLIERAKQWRAATSELIVRLVEDAAELDRTFGDGELGTLIAVDGGLGDRHLGGRAVTALSFSNGRRVVYKPRSIRAEARLQETIAWLNERGKVQLATRAILDKGPYGWDTYVERRPCKTWDELDRYFDRVGGLLALFLVVRGGDLHFDNVIADGEWPFVVDAEAIFRPRVHDRLDRGLSQAVRLALDSSVLGTGLLPRIASALSDAAGVDVSATAARPDAPITLDATLLTNVGTDEMAIRRGIHHLREIPSVPMLDGTTVDPSHHSEAILNGFESTYRAISRDATELRSVLSRFGDDPIRIVLRPTRVYGELRLAASHPASLRDALEVDAVYDHLAVRPVGAHPLSAVAAERRQLIDGDIPVFHGTPKGSAVIAPDGSTVESLALEPGLDAATRRIETMGDDDLSRERWLIRAALGMPAREDRGPKYEERPLAGEWAEAAAEIARTLVNLAFDGEHRAWWLELRGRQTGGPELRPLGLDLYDGAPGVVLFLATHGVVTVDPSAVSVAQAGVRSIRELLRSADADKLMPVGAFSGWGGLAYVFGRLGMLWASEQCVEEALWCLERGAEMLDDADSCCLVSGAPGLAIVAAAICSMTSSTRARAVVEQATSTLRDLAAVEHGQMLWRSNEHDRRALTGLAHGAAGTAWSLYEAGRCLEDESLLELAGHALAFEREMFEPRSRNWRDLRQLPGRPDLERTPNVAWCHGAPGIGLSRALVSQICPGVELASELDVAMATTMASPAADDDGLCHGEFGKIDVLLTSGQLARRLDLIEAANRRAQTTLERARVTGWRLGAPGAVSSPGLMTGLAGIGYQLLRLASPHDVPSMLALQLAAP